MEIIHTEVTEATSISWKLR